MADLQREETIVKMTHCVQLLRARDICHQAKSGREMIDRPYIMTGHGNFDSVYESFQALRG